jgi:hypothetical protein
MLDIMFYMTHYPTLLHHPKEDLAFARIAARSPPRGRSSMRWPGSTRC